MEQLGSLMNVPEYYRRNSKLAWILVVLSIAVTVVVSVAMVLGIQSHNDRVLATQIEESESDLRLVGAQISEIKDRDLKTMAQYVDAYAQIEALTTIYDQKLQRFSDLCRIAEQRVQNRSLVNIQGLYRYTLATQHNALEIVDLVRQVNEITKKEASVIHDMSSLPENEQVQFWHEEFMPLAAQEHALREKLLVVGQRSSSQRSTQ